MRLLNPNRRMAGRSTWWVALAWIAGSLMNASGAASPVAFTLEIGGDQNVPTIRLRNESRVAITKFELTIGDFDKSYDSVSSFSGLGPSGGVTVHSPDTENGGTRKDTISLTINGLEPGRTLVMSADVDGDGGDSGENYRRVLFNNGEDRPNATAKVTLVTGEFVSLTLPDGAADLSNYVYVSEARPRQLRLRSVTEAGGVEFVNKVALKVDGVVFGTNLGDGNPAVYTVYDGETLEVTAPREVYRNIYGDDISDSVENDPKLIQDEAQERFTAIGISVNDVPQSGDPTLLRIDVEGDTSITVKWQHEYALVVEHDFSNTESQERDAGGDDPWAGPLVSAAEGNPQPQAKKNWVKKGETVVAQVDGQVLDFNRPGLDIRYVPTGFVAAGAPNRVSPPQDNRTTRQALLVPSQILDADALVTALSNGSDPVSSYLWGRFTDDGTNVLSDVSLKDEWAETLASELNVILRGVAIYDATRFAGVTLRTETLNLKAKFDAATLTAEELIRFNRLLIEDAQPESLSRSRLVETFFPFVVRQAQPLRQQVSQFTMSSPGVIRYVWNLQFGVRVTVDDVQRATLPKIEQIVGGSVVEIGAGEGVFWFDPGASIRVLSAARVAGPDSLALRGWFNGDGYYFSNTGDIDSETGNLTLGGPADRPDNAGKVGNWLESDISAQTQVEYRGLEIPQLLRAARVFWRYDRQALTVRATIGQHVFQDDPTMAAAFNTPPTRIQLLSVTGRNTSVGSDGLTVWDPVAQKLYPLVPGRFIAQWRPVATSPETIDVTVDVSYPSPAHYPHVAGTPPVALDPDPNDDFVFREIRYFENDASVDANKRFTATTEGKSVLLFTSLQRDGRGQPREFLRVRVVDTIDWETGLVQGFAIIGKKVEDPTLDRAKLGTGYVYDPTETARYNPFVYDVSKLEGLAAKDVYDMTALRSDAAAKIVLRKNKLPGPVIPVNLFPGATKEQRLIVVWYDDPAENDLLMWPHRAGVYVPRWPENSDEGLGRIVIASQFGSEGVDANGDEQVVAPATVPLPEETTYNPSRFQQVQVYSQPDRTKPGFNPNEEHGLMAPSLRFAEVSPRPPAVYALRNNDLNRWQGSGVNDENYTSEPYVLSQYFDATESEFMMKVYRVQKEDPNIVSYQFAPKALITPATEDGSVATSVSALGRLPFVRMEAGEPVIPFYPLGVAIGASPCAETFGVNIKGQSAYWEDWRGSSWAVSGDENSWFTVSFLYPLAPDFWWEENTSGFLRQVTTASSIERRATEAETGDCVAFLPSDISSLLTLAPESVVSATSPILTKIEPTRILYKADWPENPPVLKAGETLSFAGGEFRSDRPFRTVGGKQVETSGLPGIVAFASAEVVFDSLNAQGNSAAWKEAWTARVAQVLDRRAVPLALADFPAELQPATKRTRVSGGKFVFNDLPASLQRRVLYDPLRGQLEILGILNDKKIGDRTLTAAPPAVFVLEPNILTDEERVALRDLNGTGADTEWDEAVDLLYRLSRNPSLVDTDNSFFFDLPADDASAATWQRRLEQFWRHYYFGVLPSDASTSSALGNFPTVADLGLTDPVPPPIPIDEADEGYLVGLEPRRVYDAFDKEVTVTEIEPVDGQEGEEPEEFPRPVLDPKQAVPLRAFGPGLALLPNPAFLDPSGGLPTISWVTVVENNDPSLGGSPITVHVIQVDRRERYRGAIKTIESDNVFDENLALRHTGDFGANAGELFFEWWYRFDDGSLNVPPPDLIEAGQTSPWKLFPDPTGRRGAGRYQITLKGNPNVPEALLADSFWFVRYRHKNDLVEGSNWEVPQGDGSPKVNFTWAGAGNSDPFNDFDANGVPDYRAQLAQGWVKRVLDAVNPYEARIRSFEGDNPATVSSMIAQFGRPFEGPVALNPDKNVIENVGLIELYETILRRGRSLSIDLSRPVSTPAIANALQLASTRISDFYTILGNEAYADAIDPTIGYGSEGPNDLSGANPGYGSFATAVFSFQNQTSSLIEEELALLRGQDDDAARPVYNRLFWNFTKGEGEAAYAQNYNITDINKDGFINEDDAMALFPQGHGDAWGHYLTAVRNQYDLLNHPFFNWVSRSEFYNLQDIVLKVDFLDERKFAQTAAAKAKVGAEVVNLTYRQQYVEEPVAQWQGYVDAQPERAWGVQDWARRAGQGAYFDWVTANALLPSKHPNERLEGIQKVDRQSNADIAVISANLNAVQTTFDQANRGENPLGIARDGLVFDIDPTFLEVGSTAQIGTRAVQGLMHFDQIFERALKMMEHGISVWNYANESRNHVRSVANSEAEFRNAVFQEDLAYRNQLIKLFGKPYEGTIGPGKVYPAGYDGPDVLLYMYADVREITDQTVPGPIASFATFGTGTTALSSSDIYKAFEDGQGSGSAPRGTLADIDKIPPEMQLYLSEDVRRLFAPTFVDPSGGGTTPVLAKEGLYAVNYTDLESPKVPLDRLTQLLPVTAAGYTFQAPREWGQRLAVGELQLQINRMIQQEAQVAVAIGAYDALQGAILREIRFINAKLDMQANIRLKNEVFGRLQNITLGILTGIDGVIDAVELGKDTVTETVTATISSIPTYLPTVGLAVSPGDALAPVRGGGYLASVGVSTGLGAGIVAFKAVKAVIETAFSIANFELELFEKRETDALAAKEMLKGLENLVGDEPIRRIQIFKELQNLRELSDEYRAMVDEATRLIDERAAFNKRVAAQTQRNRYQDMTFRVSRNHALQTYRAAFDLTAKYAYLAAKAYDYETNYDPDDPGSARDILQGIIRARTLGRLDGEPRLGAGGLAEELAKLRQNYEVVKSQLGMKIPQIEIGKISLRTEKFRILPKVDPTEEQPEPDSPVQPDVDGFPSPGALSDDLWKDTLQASRVEDLWMVPEFRYYCRPFNSERDTAGNHVPEPGLVLRFSSRIQAGKNFFGHPLTGGDQVYDPSTYATKIQSVGVWFSDYLSSDVLADLPATPRVYLVPVGTDIMSVPSSADPDVVRLWNVVDQHIPAPFAATRAQLDTRNWIPVLDSLNGRFGEPRKYSMFRAYHDGGNAVNSDELVLDTRLIGRSIWNTQWLLIIPGRMLNADPEEGLERFIRQVSDIKLVFRTYGLSGG
ncbi:MAG: hypothetical protein JNK85_28025 [Verrucomicrobiales bacterium]|nr:hypothetical protein [Verrucomicrobiales bacterium]